MLDSCSNLEDFKYQFILKVQLQDIYINPLPVTPFFFLIVDIKMHYTNLNGCNSRMLWNTDQKMVLF